MIGHRDRGIYSEGLMPYVFKGEYSEWSNTQTITLPGTSPSPMPSTTIPEYPACMILLLALIVTLLTIVIIRRKNQ